MASKTAQITVALCGFERLLIDLLLARDRQVIESLRQRVAIDSLKVQCAKQLQVAMFKANVAEKS